MENCWDRILVVNDLFKVRKIIIIDEDVEESNDDLLNYYTQLNNLNLDNITYPLNKSLEQYLSDLGQPSYNILQLP
jgi:hypothetical protein